MATPLPQKPSDSSLAEPATRSRPRNRRRLWITVAVIAVLAAAAATAVLLEPWKKKANLPLQIGTLALSTRELPWPIAQALIPAHNLLTPPGADTWWAATYEDLANGRQLVDVFIAPLGNPNPSARVEELFQAFTTGSSEYTFSLVNVHAVNAFPATMSASCGEQDINEEDTDVAHMIIGDPVYIYKHLVFCAWADADFAATVVFMERDMASSEANLLSIWRTALG